MAKIQVSQVAEILKKKKLDPQLLREVVEEMNEATRPPAETLLHARAASYVPLYEMLCEIVYAIKDDYEASSEMKALARRGRKTLDEAKARVARAEQEGVSHG
jgi:hypothetical protein